jgi:dTDP-4-dehydrorhamnose reductase
MKIAITGSDGQLGKSLNDAFLGTPHKITLLNRTSLDITNSESTLKAISSLKPDWIINCAAYTNVDQAEIEQDLCSAVNTKGVENLIVAASKTKSKFIQISTDYVFDGSQITPWQENDKRNPISYYGKTKADAESLILENYSAQSAIIRTSWLYSKYGKNFVKTMVNVGENGASELNVVSDQIGQPTSCVDLSYLILDVIDADLAGLILHGTNSGSASWHEFAKSIFKLSGFDSKRVRPILSKDYPQKASRPKNSVLGHGLFKEVGLKPMRNWYVALEFAMVDILNETRHKGQRL